MRIYHGTTLSRAIRIQSEGFQFQGMDEILQDISFHHSFPIEELRAILKFRFAMTDERDGFVCFTDDFQQASSYAQRAPEIQWEALTQIYRQRHNLGADWNLSNELHWWVTKQMMHDPPVVIEIKTDSKKMYRGGLLSDEYRHPTPFHEMSIIKIHPISRWVDFDLLRFITGYENKDRMDFIRLVEDGCWGQYVIKHPLHNHQWCLEEIIERCSVERKIQLGILSIDEA